MLDIAIVDDEKEEVEKLKSYVDKYFQDAYAGRGGGTPYKVSCFSDGIDFLSSAYGRFDIVFLDINMPIKDGIEVAKEFRKNNETACLVFVTKMANMAIRGYEVNATDFIVKPVDYNDFYPRLKRVIDKARLHPQEFITVTSNRIITKVSVQSIKYVEVVYHRIIYHTLSGDIEEWGSMSGAEERLKAYNFARCNSGYLVNLRYVESVNNDEVQIGGEKLPISRRRRVEFIRRLTEYLGKNK